MSDQFDSPASGDGSDEATEAQLAEMVWFAEQFEHHRPRLRAVAYRMLGSTAEADDALQDAWVRTTRSDSGGINNVEAWLTALVGRVCIDMLRSRHSRREEYPGTWLPEPVVGVEDPEDPEKASLLADSLGLALLVVLETLEPAERLAFVLHDMFGVPFGEIAPIVDRTPAAARQLASRARRRVRGAQPAADTDLGTQRRVVDAFLAAARAGDFEQLLTVLDPDVVLRVDSGQRGFRSPALLSGARDVAQHSATHGHRFASLCEPAIVNGSVGVVATGRAGVVAVVSVRIGAGRITALDLILDPDKLARIHLA